MAFIAAKCTQCGSVIEVDSSKEVGICHSCGTVFVTEKIIYSNTQNIKIENAIIQNGSNIENLLLRAVKYDAIDQYMNVRKIVDMILSIDANHKEALLLYDKNREYCFRLSTFKYTFLLKKHVDEIEICMNNRNLEQALDLFERHALIKLRKGQYEKILKKWQDIGLQSVLDLEFCTKAICEA